MDTRNHLDQGRKASIAIVAKMQRDYASVAKDFAGCDGPEDREIRNHYQARADALRDVLKMAKANQ